MRVPSFSFGVVGAEAAIVSEEDDGDHHLHQAAAANKDEMDGKSVVAQIAEHQDQINQLRSRLCSLAPEDQLEDHKLLQWLTARNFNINKAEHMFRKSTEWKETIDIEHIMEYEPPEVLVKYSPMGIVGFDRYGGTVLIVPHGRVDIRGLLMSAKKLDYIRYTIQTMERAKRMMEEESKRQGRPIYQQTVVFDLEGFSIKEFTWKPALDVILELMQAYESNYPELLRCAYAVNAPKVFTIAFALIKPFLHDATISKVKIFGKTGWKELLQKDISPEVLPKHWGGERVDPDGNEMCPSVLCLGGEVPKSYYLKNKAKETRINHTSLVVGKGSMEKVKVQVTKPDSILRWEFESDDYDVSFGVMKEGATEPLLPMDRVNSHITPEEGQVSCPTPGTYLLMFDNSFSYMRSKKVYYTIDVIAPPTPD